ncbi:MAG: tyrosine-type recombinase/integrase [Chloroflexi bacterium]|nr:tyrosine-type recombinase/integrase [Chloroflexota bacterium]
MHPDIQRFLETLADQSGYSPNTRLAYTYDLKRLDAFVRGLEGGEAAAITVARMSEFLVAEARAGFSRRTLERRRVVARRLAQALAGEQSSPAEFGKELGYGGTALRHPAPEPSAPPLTDGDLVKISVALSGSRSARAIRDRAIFNLLLESGMQISQLVGLNLGDSIRFGNTGKQPAEGGELPEPQTSLERYLRDGRPELVHGSNEAALFISQMGSRMTRQAVWAMLRALGKSADLERPLTPRRLRHTAAERMLRDGLAFDDLQRRLGHQSPVSTRALLDRLAYQP